MHLNLPCAQRGGLCGQKHKVNLVASIVGNRADAQLFLRSICGCLKLLISADKKLGSTSFGEKHQTLFGVDTAVMHKSSDSLAPGGRRPRFAVCHLQKLRGHN